MEGFSVRGNRPTRELLLVGACLLAVLAFLLFGRFPSGDGLLSRFLVVSCLVALVALGFLARPARWRLDPTARRLTCTVLWGLSRRVVEASEVGTLELLPKVGHRERRLVLRRRRASPLVVRTGTDVLQLRRDGRLLAEGLGVPWMEPDPETGRPRASSYRFWMEPGVARRPTEVPGRALLKDLAFNQQAWSFTVPVASEPGRSHGFQVTPRELSCTTPEGETHRFGMGQIEGIAVVRRRGAPPEGRDLGILTSSGLVHITGSAGRPARRGEESPLEVTAHVLLAAVRDLQE